MSASKSKFVIARTCKWGIDCRYRNKIHPGSKTKCKFSHVSLEKRVYNLENIVREMIEYSKLCTVCGGSGYDMDKDTDFGGPKCSACQDGKTGGFLSWAGAKRPWNPKK